MPVLDKSAKADELVFKATGAEVSPEIMAQIDRIQVSLEKELNAAAASIEEAMPSVAAPPSFLWNLLSYGPIRLGGAPPSRPNKVIASGTPCVIYGISYAPGFTAGWFVGKDYTARCSIRNMTTMAPLAQLPAIAPAIDLGALFRVHRFFFVAPPVPAGAAAPHLFEFDYTIDMQREPGAPTSFAVDGAGYANWHFDPDSAIGVPAGGLFLPPVGGVGGAVVTSGVPAQPAQWRNGMSGRFLVNNAND